MFTIRLCRLTNARLWCRYSVDGDRILSDNTCFSPGPPNYYWAAQGGLSNVPDKDANTP